MKKIIKKVLSVAGYKVERLDNPNPLLGKYRKLLEEYYASYRELKFHNLPALNDTTVDLICKLDGTQVSEAIYILNALNEVKNLPGDICEYGVAQGFTSALLAFSIKDTTKDFWLFDSFEGLPAPTEKDKLKDDIFNLKSMEAYKGTMKHSVKSVLRNLEQVDFPLTRTKIVDGFIEDTLRNKKMPEKVSFAYVDFDFYNPIRTALEFLDKVIVPGGVIIVDDYDFFSEGAKVAVDEFHDANTNNYTLEVPVASIGYFAVLRKKT